MEPTYEGLKHITLSMYPAPSGPLEPTYEGLKREYSWASLYQGQPPLEPTYEGLKPFTASRSSMVPVYFGAYL